MGSESRKKGVGKKSSIWALETRTVVDEEEVETSAISVAMGGGA